MSPIQKMQNDRDNNKLKQQLSGLKDVEERLKNNLWSYHKTSSTRRMYWKHWSNKWSWKWWSLWRSRSSQKSRRKKAKWGERSTRPRKSMTKYSSPSKKPKPKTEWLGVSHMWVLGACWASRSSKELGYKDRGRVEDTKKRNRDSSRGHQGKWFCKGVKAPIFGKWALPIVF